MPVADWTVPFDLTSKVYTNHPSPSAPGGVSTDPLPINAIATFPSGTGYYLLRSDGCSLTSTVRMTKDFVPQADGAILHRRFTGGMEMALTIQMWQDSSQIACDALLEEMVDTLMGYLYGLLNAGDNEGRIRWAPTGGTSGAPNSNGYRMLEDIKLMSYPVGSQQPGNPYEIGFTIDSAYPYTADETQLSPSIPADPVVNYGNRPTYPVWKIYSTGATLSFTLTNTTTGDSFSFSDGQPGCQPVTGYVEIDTFRNSVLINNGGTLYNGAAGVVMETSDFFLIPPGSNTITCPGVGGASTCLINAAWC